LNSNCVVDLNKHLMQSGLEGLIFDNKFSWVQPADVAKLEICYHLNISSPRHSTIRTNFTIENNSHQF